MTELQELAQLINDADNVEPQPKIKTFDKRGRGRKQCPKCKVIIGVRHKVCICGHTFKRKQKKKWHRDPEVAKAINLLAGLGYYPSKQYRILYVPAGKPPVKFQGAVKRWATNTAQDYYLRNYIVAPSCLVYLLKKQGGTKANVETLKRWIDKISVDVASEILDDKTDESK